MKVLLMGGTGWLGHSIAKVLEAENVDFTILTRGRKQTFADDIPACQTITADKSDESAMKDVLAAGYSHIIDTVPTEASINIIAKYAVRLKHYLHCSSTGGYAPLPFVPCNETAPYKGFNNGTGWAQKARVDNLSMDYFRKGILPATVIRPCYITGPGMLPLDNLGGRRTDFIPDILAENTLELPNDGQALLQPIHVKELARSFWLAINHLCSLGQIYNICLDHAVTLNKYLEINAAALGKTPHISYVPLEDLLAKHKGNVDEIGLRFLACHMCFSIDKARKDLEYSPRYTPEEAIEETAIWASNKG